MELAACIFSFMVFVACLFFVRKTCCMFVFSSWNLYIDFSLRETDFIHGFVASWFFVVMKLVVCCFCSWNLLHVGFYLRETSIFVFSSWNLFCSWNLLHVDFSLRETYKLIFSPPETDLVHGNCWELIFVRRTRFVLILLMKLVHVDFFS